MTRPVVSICILTYQHSRFIAKSIEGAIMQKTDFPFEILIGEDESTDGTREICLDYARRYPDRVRVFLRSRKDVVYIDGRARGSFNFRMTLREARGEFIALCEGDDFWTDPAKLQTQVDYLRANPDCVGCFHDAQLVDGENAVLQKSYFSSRKSKFNQHDVLETLLSAEPTCSMLFRRNAFKEPLPEWYLRRPSDLYLDILLTESGSLGFIRKNMAAYRKHPGGVWSGQRESNQIIELIVRFKLLLADPFFFGKYRELILRKIDEFQAMLFTRGDTAAEIDRLDKIVAEQTAALKATTQDRDRLQAETDAMAGQRDQFAATSTQQTAYITTLEAERDSLRQTNAFLAAESKRHLESLAAQEAFITQLRCQHAGHDQALAALKDQLDKLAATSHEQAAYIASLEKQRDQLGDEIRAACETAASNDQSVATLNARLVQLTEIAEKQTAYIASLESERDALRRNNADTLAESQRRLDALSAQESFIDQLKSRLTDHDKTLPALKEQLDQLAATAREQTAYIASLEKQRDQLGNEIRAACETTARNDKTAATLSAQLAQLADSTKKQTAYIATLESERDSLHQDRARVLAESKRHLDSLSEQDRFISQLKEQQADHEALIASLRDQLNALGQTAVEQTAYIESLKAECEQARKEDSDTRALLSAEQHTATIARDELAQAHVHNQELKATLLETESRLQATIFHNNNLQTLLETASTLAAEQDRRISHLVDQLGTQEQAEARFRSLAQSRLVLLRKMHLRQTSQTRHLIETISNHHKVGPSNPPDSS